MRPVCVDLVDWQKTQSAVQSLGHIDLLVNNAGVAAIEAIVDVTSDSFDRQVAMPLTLLFRMCLLILKKSFLC